MSLERRNPLPPGRYWLDAFPPHLEELQAWVAANRGAVRVAATEHYDAKPASTFGWTAALPERQWTLFDVTTPVEFPNLSLGYPEIVSQTAQNSKSGTPIDTGVKTSDDTVDRGVDDPALPSWLLPLLIVGVAAYAITKGKE